MSAPLKISRASSASSASDWSRRPCLYCSIQIAFFSFSVIKRVICLAGLPCCSGCSTYVGGVYSPEGVLCAEFSARIRSADLSTNSSSFLPLNPIFSSFLYEMAASDILLVNWEMSSVRTSPLMRSEGLGSNSYEIAPSVSRRGRTGGRSRPAIACCANMFFLASLLFVVDLGYWRGSGSLDSRPLSSLVPSLSGAPLAPSNFKSRVRRPL